MTEKSYLNYEKAVQKKYLIRKFCSSFNVKYLQHFHVKKIMPALKVNHTSALPIKLYEIETNQFFTTFEQTKV